jgi:hypothetical protein
MSTSCSAVFHIHSGGTVKEQTYDSNLGSIVSIATGYEMDGPGIKSQWGWNFLHPFRLAQGPTQRPVQWVLDKEQRGHNTDPSPPSSAVVKEM